MSGSTWKRRASISPAPKGNQYARKAEQKVLLSVRISPALHATLLELDGGVNFSSTIEEVLDAGVTVLMGQALDDMSKEPLEIDEN